MRWTYQIGEKFFHRIFRSKKNVLRHALILSALETVGDGSGNLKGRD